MHCFNGTWDLCEKWLYRYPRCMIGLTTLITDPAASHLTEVAKHLDLNRLLIETDAPFFPPYAVRTTQSAMKFRLAFDHN